jgi:hypothetical protein
MVGAPVGCIVGVMVGAPVGCIVGIMVGVAVGCVLGGFVDEVGVGGSVGDWVELEDMVGEALGLDVGESRGPEGAIVGAEVTGIIPSYISNPGANTKGVQTLRQQ